MTPEELKSTRKRMELSQAQLADILGYDVTTISRMERGKLAIPKVMVYALARSGGRSEKC